MHWTYKWAKINSSHDCKTCSFTIITFSTAICLKFFYHNCNENYTDRQPCAVFQDCERRRGPPCLLQKLLSWVRLASDSVKGREKTSKAGKVLKNTTSLRRARRWSSFNRGCGCLSPTHKMPVEGKLQTHSGTESSTGSSEWQQLPHSVSAGCL